MKYEMDWGRKDWSCLWDRKEWINAGQEEQGTGQGNTHCHWSEKRVRNAAIWEERMRAR